MIYFIILVALAVYFFSVLHKARFGVPDTQLEITKKDIYNRTTVFIAGIILALGAIPLIFKETIYSIINLEFSTNALFETVIVVCVLIMVIRVMLRIIKTRKQINNGEYIIIDTILESKIKERDKLYLKLYGHPYSISVTATEFNNVSVGEPYYLYIVGNKEYFQCFPKKYYYLSEEDRTKLKSI